MSFGPSPAIQGDVRIKALEVMVQSLQERVSRLESGNTLNTGNTANKAGFSKKQAEPKGEFFSEFAGCERIPRVAPKASLLDPHGNVIERSDRDVYKDPPLWIKKGGQSYAGKKFSQCPPDFLRDVASFAEWKAGKDHEEKVLAKNGKPKWVYDCYEASAAAGWAKLIEEYGTHDQTTPEPARSAFDVGQPESTWSAEDDAPF